MYQSFSFHKKRENDRFSQAIGLKRTKILKISVWPFWEPISISCHICNPFVKINILSITSAFLPALKYTLILDCMPVFYYLFKSILHWFLTETTTNASKHPCFYRLSFLCQEFPPLYCQSVKFLPAYHLQLNWEITFPVMFFWSLQVELTTSFLVSTKHHVHNSTMSLI